MITLHFICIFSNGQIKNDFWSIDSKHKKQNPQGHEHQCVRLVVLIAMDKLDVWLVSVSVYGRKGALDCSHTATQTNAFKLLDSVR